MKYNIGDLLVYKMPDIDRSIIGIIMEYNDKDDIYTIEWMFDKERWNEQFCVFDLDRDIKYQTLKHFPVK